MLDIIEKVVGLTTAVISLITAVILFRQTKK
jgi:hypothetical protein